MVAGLVQYTDSVVVTFLLNEKSHVFMYHFSHPHIRIMLPYFLTLGFKLDGVVGYL